MPISPLQFQLMQGKLRKFNPPTAPLSRDDAPESELHNKIMAYCDSKGWLYRRDRMDKRTTGPVGFPDFVIFMDHGKAVFIECKRRGGKPTPAQMATICWARKLGFIAEVVESLEGFLKVIGE